MKHARSNYSKDYATRTGALIIYALVCLAYGLLAYIVAMRLFYDEGIWSDYCIHANAVIDIWIPEGFFAFQDALPYWGWHAFLRLVLFFGLPLGEAASAVTAIFDMFSAIICIVFLDKLLLNTLHGSRRIIVVSIMTITVLMVSAIYLPWFNIEPYRGQLSPNPWHNPTIAAVRPFALLTIMLFTSAIAARELPLGKLFLLTLLVLVGIIMKPSFFAVLFPAVVAFAAIDYVFNGQVSFDIRLISVFFIPCIIAFGVLVVLFFNGSDSVASDGIVFSFFDTPYSPNAFISPLLLLAFPVFAICVCRREIFQSGSPYILILLILLVGFCEWEFISEPGERALHANFGWGYISAAFISFLYLIGLFVKNAFEGRLSRGEIIGGVSILALHLFSGIYYYLYLLLFSVNQC